MGRVVCVAKKNGVVKCRGTPSIEFYKNGKPQYYCNGYLDMRMGSLLEPCRNCKDYVSRAQDDLDEWNKRKGGVSDGID